MTADPVAEALDRATSGLDDDAAADVRRLMALALAEFDAAVVTPEDQAVEVDAALAVPPRERLAAARHYVAVRRTFTLGRRAGDLLVRFAAGDSVSAEAGELLTEVTAMLEQEPPEDVREDLSGYALECRYIQSDGEGPLTTRGTKLVRR